MTEISKVISCARCAKPRFLRALRQNINGIYIFWNISTPSDMFWGRFCIVFLEPTDCSTLSDRIVVRYGIRWDQKLDFRFWKKFTPKILYCLAGFRRAGAVVRLGWEEYVAARIRIEDRKWSQNPEISINKTPHVEQSTAMEVPSPAVVQPPRPPQMLHLGGGQLF